MFDVIGWFSVIEMGIIMIGWFYKSAARAAASYVQHHSFETRFNPRIYLLRAFAMEMNGMIECCAVAIVCIIC